MPRRGFVIAVTVAALLVWRLGHGGAAIALLLLVLCLEMSAYVRHLRPPRPGLWPQRHAQGGFEQE